MRRVPLVDELGRARPDVADPAAAIAAGLVQVDGVIVTNPRSLVRPGCSIVVRTPSELRGSVKLRAALDAFGIEVTGRVALDVGAATGGFVTVLLERGASRVYAVDAGHGQLLGSLRQDERVVDLEATNVADLEIDEAIGLVTVDVSYLSLASAVSQLDRVRLEDGASLIGLVKPMFELRLGRAPTDPASLDRATEAAASGIERAGWEVRGTMASPVRGANGAIEGFVRARYLGEGVARGEGVGEA